MSTTNHQSNHEIDFVTLGMFIIDDIYPPPSQSHLQPQKDVIGGAGTYSAVGARLFSPAPEQSKSVGWIVDTGTDFPTPVRDLIDSWQTGCLLRERQGLTTRGWNGYGENEHRAFKYLTPKLRLTADDLPGNLLASKSFHLICGAGRCIDIVQRIRERREAELGSDVPQPLIVWEPVPDLCVASEFEITLEACKYVDVISPNHEELLALFSGRTEETGAGWRGSIAQMSRELLVTDRLAVVLRCGKEGAYFAKLASLEASVNDGWLPAYYKDDSSKVEDPTGGGNGFLGGFAVGLVRNQGDLKEAVAWGNVSASLCIEQVGVPAVTSSPDSRAVDEQWNGSSVLERLTAYQRRITDIGM
ncbi:Ribokinase-like protein [Polychaeton citri CBS 116435]|uniref:Ribokinase-like protein n=1 Tax=Polychaeton citri CBS 116435 TaxID=1314669 RepID=A0A9P4QCW5_9PEZI|nr:Ribokinase-like protein [Polychaeton citri CBS 116435]